MNKSDGNDILSIDWEAAQFELQKEIEENNKRQEVENEKKKQEELDNLKKDLEDKYTKEKQEIEEKLRKQLLDYEQKLKEMNQSVEKSKIENERMNVEVLLQERLKILEADKAKKKREYEIKEKMDNQKKEQKKNQEIIHKSEKLDLTLHNVVRKLNKLKIICNELKRNVSLDIHLSKNFSDLFENKIDNTIVQVKVYNQC